MKKIIFILMFVIYSSAILAQQEVKQVQPSIMVMPWTKEGEDIRTVIENDFNKRIAMTKVKEAFDKRGFTTYDFVTKLKQAMNEMTLASDSKTDLRASMIKMSAADIIVLVNIHVQKSSSGTSVKLILQANDKFTAQALSNKTGDSGRFYTDDIAKLSEKAVESCIDSFLITMNNKFTDIVKNGRSIRITIGFDEDSEYNMDSEVGANEDVLSDLLEDWVDDNAYKNNSHIQGTTETQMIIDDFRIPLRDDKGRNYKASKVYRKIRNFLKKYGLKAKAKTKTEALISILIQ